MSGALCITPDRWMDLLLGDRNFGLTHHWGAVKRAPRAVGAPARWAGVDFPSVSNLHLCTSLWYSSNWIGPSSSVWKCTKCTQGMQKITPPPQEQHAATISTSCLRLQLARSLLFALFFCLLIYFLSIFCCGWSNSLWCEYHLFHLRSFHLYPFDLRGIISYMKLVHRICQ